MRKSLRIIASSLLVISLIFIDGCKKGDTGPAGKDGSANVAYHTFSINSWNSNSSRYYTNLTVAEITSGNLNSASVEVYYSATSGVWVALPYTYVSTPNNYFMGFNISVNQVQVTWDCNSTISIGSDPNAIFGTTVQIKVVVIPPAMIKKNVNLNNYQEVKQAYSLKD